MSAVGTRTRHVVFVWLLSRPLPRCSVDTRRRVSADIRAVDFGRGGVSHRAGTLFCIPHRAPLLAPLLSPLLFPPSSLPQNH
ncbi:hypothetical protein B0H13DRAFT_2052200, partial [Mycena leptocephala]